MEEELISFETAKLAKKKGFDIEVLNHYGSSECLFMDDLKNSELEYFECSAPTQSLLQKWLRKKYGIQIKLDTIYHDGWNYNIEIDLNILDYFKSIDEYVTWHDVFLTLDSYEEALEEALIGALKLIK